MVILLAWCPVLQLALPHAGGPGKQLEVQIVTGGQILKTYPVHEP